jgi:aspartyl-tRNA(Asn)/glutamyl-tRNA(Gln) amidotransferase subunit C
MALDKATVEHIGRLARLALREEEKEALAGELSQILSWVEQLGELDTRGVEPMTSVVAMTLPMREDVVNDGGDRDAVLANAPQAREGFYVVPKVVE